MATSYPKLPKRKKPLPLPSFLPKLGDTALVDEEIERVVSRFERAKVESIYEKESLSGLVQARGFYEAILHLELVLEYKEKYDATERCIRTHN